MDQTSVLIRYMDLFQPVDVPDGRDRYAHFAQEARAIAQSLGCEDGQRSQFEVRYGGQQFYVYIRSPHLPLEHNEYMAGLQVPKGYEFRVSLLDVDGTWMWLDLPGMTAGSGGRTCGRTGPSSNGIRTSGGRRRRRSTCTKWLSCGGRRHTR